MAYQTGPGAIIRIGVDGVEASRRQINSVGQSMDQLASTARTAFGALAAAIGAGAGVSGLVQMADEYAKFTAQLRLASQSTREYADSYADVKRIANDSQQSLSATGVLYARIANGTRDLGIAQSQVAKITEVVNMSLKVSGATAAESASAQLQLSQAFASGTLRGEEFNAVNEAAPRLMLALADGIGVPVGALKKMAGEGLITSKIMADVLPNALEKVREEAKQVQTIAGAFTGLKNNMLEFVGIQANASGTVSVMTKAIGLLADNLVLVAGAMATVVAASIGSVLATWASNAYLAVTANIALRASTLANAVTATGSAAVIAAAKLVEIRADTTAAAASATLATARVVELRSAVLAAEGAAALAIATNGLIPAQARAAALAEALALSLATEAIAANAATTAALASTAALTAQTAAATLAARAMGVLRAAMAFLGGPIGLLITAIGLAATAWAVYGNKAKEENDKATVAVEESTVEMIARLDKQIEKLDERNALLNVQPGLKDNNKADVDGLARAYAALNAARDGTGQYATQSSSMRQLAEIDLLANYTEALGKSEKAHRKVAEAASGTRDVQIKKWFDDNGSSAQKMAAELDGLKKQFGTIPPEMEKLVRAKYVDKGAAKAIKQEETAYTSLITTIGEKIAAGKLELRGYDQLSESQKLTIKLDEAVKSGKNKVGDEHIKVARAAIVELAAIEALTKARETEKNITKYIEQSTIARRDSTAELAVEYALYGQSNDARAIAMIAVKEQTALEKFLLTQKEAGNAVTVDQIAQLNNEAAARVNVEQATLAQGKALGYANQLADENKKFSAESIFNEKDRALALLAIDADMWRERIALAGNGIEAQKKLQSEFDTWYANQSIKPAQDQQKKMWDSIEQTAHDTFISIFDSGKSAFDRLRDTLKNGLLDLLYQMTVKKWIFQIGAAVTGGGVTGTAQAAGSSMLGSAASSAMTSMGTSMGMTAATSAISAYGAGVAASIGGGTSGAAMAASLATSGNLATGAAAGVSTGASVSTALAAIPVWGWAALAAVAVAAYFGGKGEKEVTSKGIEGTVGGNAFSGNSFQNWQQDGGWFSSDSKGHDTAALDMAMTKQLTQTYAGLQGGALAAATALGLSTLAISNYSEKISVELSGKVEDAAKDAAAIAAMFDSVGNNMAAAVAPGIAALAKEGEVAGVTLTRLSGSITTANAWLSMLRQRLFQVSLAGGDAASKLADAFGSLDNLAAASKTFYDLYYTEGERAARSQEDMTAALAKVNLAMPDTMTSLRALAGSLDLNTDAGRTAYATLLAVAPEFAAVATATAKMAAETAKSLLIAFSGDGKLTPALDATLIKSLALSSNLSDTLSSSMSDAQVKTVALATGMTEAQVRAGALTGAISIVASYSDGTAGALYGLNDAVWRAGVNTTGTAWTLDNLAGSMSDAQVKAVALATGMTEAQVRSGALIEGFGSIGYWANTANGAVGNATGGLWNMAVHANNTNNEIGGLNGSLGVIGNTAGSISTIFLDAKSGLISFGHVGASMNPIFTGAQISALLLNNEIDGLKRSAAGSIIDIAGLGNALANVNTETFVTTMGLVFDNLATRISGVIDGISTERLAVREAALQIINPTVMSRNAIYAAMAGINTALPSNAVLANSASVLQSSDERSAAATQVDASARASLQSVNANIANAQSLVSARQSTLNAANVNLEYLALKARSGGDLWRQYAAQVPAAQAAVQAASNALGAANWSAAEASSHLAAAQTTAAAASNALVVANNSYIVAAANAKAQQLAYASALQNFAIDAGKSVSKLSRLREETVKYYDTQKQLADLMSSSAAGLRTTIADYRYSQMTDAQQFDSLQVRYATAYSMALSTDGEVLAGYGSTINSALNPLLEKAKEVLSGSEYAAFASTAIARAESIAGRLEALTPTNYAADSLLMLVQIDATLAALDESSKSAERIISDAVKAGSDRTADGLRAVIAALTGNTIPAFAMGGDHAGGLRLVGENGPELEVTGPSRIFNAAQTRGLLGGGGSTGNTARLEVLVERQTQELSDMRAELRAIASSNAKMERLADRVYVEGTLVRTDADTPLNTVAA